MKTNSVFVLSTFRACGPCSYPRSAMSLLMKGAISWCMTASSRAAWSFVRNPSANTDLSGDSSVAAGQRRSRAGVARVLTRTFGIDRNRVSIHRGSE